jgi:hypothetical protein
LALRIKIKAALQLAFFEETTRTKPEINNAKSIAPKMERGILKMGSE